MQKLWQRYLVRKMAAVKLLKLSSHIYNFPLKPKYIRSAHQLASATYAQTILNIPETKVTTFDNGLKVASESSDSSSCTVGVWIEAGSRYERKNVNGVAHFFEHMAFKGTTQRSQADLEREIENMGAHLSAYTGKEETAFYAKCLSKDIPKVVEILADIIRNSKLGEQEIEQERKIILKELEEAESNLQVVTFDHLHLTAYQGTPLDRTIYGPTTNIEKITRDDLAYYVGNNYVAPRMVVAGAGGVNHEEFVKLAEKHFGSVTNEYIGEIPVVHPCRFTGSEIRVRDDWLPLAHVAIAVDTCGWTDPDIIPLLLAKTIVGSWDVTYGGSGNNSSTVAQAAHQYKLCHGFQSFHTIYRDTGLWGAYFVADGLSLEDFLYNLQTEWMRLCNSVTQGDLERAKNTLKTNLLLQLDGPTAVCKDIGSQLLIHGRRIPFTEVEEKIEAVTTQNLRDVCTKYIYDRCPAVSAVGPVEGLPDYTRIRSSMYWLRV